jgi:alpha-mannosidase
MWVEPDCQTPSGRVDRPATPLRPELLRGPLRAALEGRLAARHLRLLARRAAAPAGRRHRGFFTYKLNWSEANSFPHDLYEWEGLDGSTVLAHDFENPGQDYNGNVRPLDLLGTWRNFEGKRRHPETIFSFGWGDGGGGPTEEMLENYSRLKSFPAMPRLRMAMVEDFFEGLPKAGLPRWTGELYLELHRGTLTTQAKVKKLNREAEHRLLEAEALLALASLRGAAYPAAELEDAWKALLLNQFHDILPGTSIREVYEVTHGELEGVVRTAERLRDGALAIGDAQGETSALLVANTSLNPRPLTVLLEGEDARRRHGRRGRGPSGSGDRWRGLLVHDPERRVPGLGWTALRRAEGEGEPSPGRVPGARAEEVGGGVVSRTTCCAWRSGRTARSTASSIGRRQGGARRRANALWAYTDKPRNWEAWDVEEGYEAEGEEILADSVEVVEKGPLRASVRVTRRWGGSEIVQTYRLLSGSRRLDVETWVDWHERRVLLRALFP